MKSVLCAGLVVCDVPLRPVSHAIMEQDMCAIEAPIPSPGGDALNVSVTLTKLGVKASLCGLVGADSSGDFVFKWLKDRGVDIRGLNRHPGIGTVVSYVLIEADGNRHFAVYGELSDTFTYSDIPPELIEEADIVYFGSSMCMGAMDRGGAAALFSKAHSLGKMTIADAAGANGQPDGFDWLGLLNPMLRETDIFVPSYEEAAAISGQKELGGIRRIFSAYKLKILVVKLGGKGCYVTDFNNEWNIPAFSGFEPVDTTGAGDSFTGGFIRGLLEGWTPDTAAVFANAAAGFNITKVGATGGVPDFDTVYQYLTEHSAGARGV
jgi:sugar/nucleoside kinase (ribokinase family)